MKTLAIAVIKTYQWLFSPFVGMHCRFSPSCSNYALQAFERYDVIKATCLTVKRLLRCHPWCDGGHDPLP